MNFCEILSLFIPHHIIVAGFYGITLVIRVSVHWSSISLSVGRRSILPCVFLFPDNNLSKCEWIFTKLGVCIVIVEIWFGIANGQSLPIFDRVICLQHNNGGDIIVSRFYYFFLF